MMRKLEPRRLRRRISAAGSVGLLATAALLGLGTTASAGPATSTAPTASVMSTAMPGTWLLAYDWGCDGSYNTTTLTFNSGGTVTGSTGTTGQWVLAENQYIRNYDGYKTVYAGVATSKSVTGAMTDFVGNTGCFYMLQSGAPTALSQSRAVEPLGEIGRS